MDITNWYRTVEDEIHIHKCFGLERFGIARHGFSGRSGGVSGAPYDTLNLALHVGDEQECVIENRRRCGLSMQLDPNYIVSADQPHGKSVAVVTAEDAGRGAFDFSTAVHGVDALVTNVVGPVLALHFADCTPIFLLDPVKRAAGLVHAGWKGTIIDVAGAGVRAMVEAFGTDTRDLIAAIGPAIGRCCFEVGPDVASELLAASDGDLRVVSQGAGGTMRADVKLANWLQLKRAGIPEPNICLSQECTCCNSEEFFSYRCENVTGRMSAWMALL